MSLKAKLTVPFLALLFSVITACSTVPVNGGTDLKGTNLNQPQGGNPYIVDLGFKGGSSIGTRIKISDGDSFKTMVNLNRSGHRFLRADVNTVRVFLTTTTGTGDLSANLEPITAMPATGYIELTKATSGDINVIFTNVPGNAVYRVAVCALTTTALGLKPDGSAAFTSPRDITKGTGNFGTITLNGFENTYVLSNTGGDHGCGGACTNNKGEATINPDLSFASNPAPDQINVDITLIDAEGATIDSTVNVTEGSAVLPPVTMQ